MSERNLWPEPWYDSATSPMQVRDHLDEENRQAVENFRARRDAAKVDGPPEVRQSFVKVAMKVASAAQALLVDSSARKRFELDQALRAFDKEMGRVT